MITTKTVSVTLNSHRLAVLNAFRKKLESSLSECMDVALSLLIEKIGFKDELLESSDHTMLVLANLKSIIDDEIYTPDQIIEMLKKGSIIKPKLRNENIEIKLPHEIGEKK